MLSTGRHLIRERAQILFLCWQANNGLRKRYQLDFISPSTHWQSHPDHFPDVLAWKFHRTSRSKLIRMLFCTNKIWLSRITHFSLQIYVTDGGHSRMHEKALIFRRQPSLIYYLISANRFMWWILKRKKKLFLAVKLQWNVNQQKQYFTYGTRVSYNEPYDFV